MIELQRVDERLRSGKAIRDGVHDLAADRHLAALADKVFLGEAGVAQAACEEITIELAVDGLECRIVADQLRKAILRQSEAEFAGKLIERGTGDELGDRLLLDTESPRLFAGQLRAEALAECCNLTMVGEAEFVDVDMLVAE